MSRRFAPAVVAVVAVVACAAGAARGDGVAAGVAGWFSAEFRQGDGRLAEIEAELSSLPLLKPRPFASRYGFRSETRQDADEPQWLQIDLERRVAIDRIVAVPVHIPDLAEAGKGYGFPRRFRIEVSDDPEMARPTVVVDRTAEDFANPGRYPADFRIEPVEGRYVRFTSTRHFPIEEGFIWALEELLVLSGNESLAAGHPTSVSSSLELYPNWSQDRIRDGQSALGLPVSAEPSPTRGHLSRTTENPREQKWLQVDLGREHPIDEIRLVAVDRGGFEVLGEQAFPRGWRVALSNDPGFGSTVWDIDTPSSNLVGYPGDCAVLIPALGHRGRYLRLTTLDLWGTANHQGYGLAEIQAYSGNENVALGRPVTASDRADTVPDSGWAPEFTTDGFGSRHRLIELPQFLDRIGRRGVLESERDALVRRRDELLRTTNLALGYAGGTLGGLGLVGCGFLLIRQRTIRRRAVARLREQIARDLHDDIGTNLGGIVLLSEIGSRESGDPASREDFLSIRQSAEQTAQSMQDIVWLIERGNARLRDLTSRMREVADLVVGHAELSLSIEPPDFRDRCLSLFFRRHFFFAFKEALNNVRRHAAAGAVAVRIEVDGRRLRFEVRDDGVGFDPQATPEGGHGLANLRRRAERLKGSCQVDSRPGGGTRVVFEAPMEAS